MIKNQIDPINQVVKVAQVMLDSIVPGKVVVSTKYDSEYRCNILVGKYNDATYGECEHTETIYPKASENHSLFVGFFKQRAKYMLASIEDQLAYNGHPAFFGEEEH